MNLLAAHIYIYMRCMPGGTGARLHELEGLLGALRAQCEELGEDAAALAAQAHPSLAAAQCVARAACLSWQGMLGHVSLWQAEGCFLEC